MAVEGMTPGIIATIVIVLLLAVGLVVLYVVCRSDDPARDHTCVAMLYPRTRHELRQLRIPLDPVESTNTQVNSAYEDDKDDKTKIQDSKQHSVQINNSTSVTQSDTQLETQVNGNTTSSERKKEEFVTLGFQDSAIQ